MKFKVFRYKKVNSTNNTAIRLIKSSNLNYGMIISELQNKGRGPVSYTHLRAHET